MAEELRRGVGGLWEKILRHPFVVELYAGVLPLEKFRYYLLQDYFYLVNFAKALSLAAAKAPGVGEMKMALGLAYGTVTGEMANYERLLGEAGLSVEQAVATEPNWVNRAYMSFLLSTCALGDFYVCMAAVAPCFWTYLDIAERHREALRQNKVELYVKWASTYLTHEYRALVEEVKKVLAVAEARRLLPYFRTAAEYELEFWDAAYRIQ
ncbi:MAG: thiaminase II [Pyrobaculum sp.]